MGSFKFTSQAQDGRTVVLALDQWCSLTLLSNDPQELQDLLDELQRPHRREEMSMVVAFTIKFPRDLLRQE
jgi:hypothetical protein